MEVANIIYYSKQDGKRKTIPLRSLCLREEFDNRLETIFYAVRDSENSQDLLSNFKKICYEQIEFETENSYYIRFVVVDACDNVNYLKFKKVKSKVDMISGV